MQHFPIFLNMAGTKVAVAGGGDAALAKLRLLVKTDAEITVFSTSPIVEIISLAETGSIRLVRGPFAVGDALGRTLVYGATEDAHEDARIAQIARAEGALVNIVDNLADSAFITPAIVDRDPVTVAIGTEGAAPVLARAIKADLEERLPVTLGLLARIGKNFRAAAEVLPMGRKRRDFWRAYFFSEGARALEEGGQRAVKQKLSDLLDRHVMRKNRDGHVAFVGAGPGDPELLTLKARKALDEADVVIFDRLIAPEILELARREALLIDVGKEGFGRHTPQEEINALLVEHSAKGAQVVRLKSGDSTVFGRLDEEIDALDHEGISWNIVPGITAASSAVAQIGQSLTKRGRNSSVRFLTGHDTKGFCDHDWRTLANPGEVAAIYMGKKSARFIQGRLLMHGAAPETPVTIIENASRANARILATTLAALEPSLSDAAFSGPALMFLGLAPRDAQSLIDNPALKEAIQ